MTKLTLAAIGLALAAHLGADDLCPTPQVCIQRGAFVQTIDPYCCKDGADFCDDYKIDKYQCTRMAGTYGYYNLQVSHHWGTNMTCTGGQGLSSCN